jgi:hypothetical protein
MLSAREQQVLLQFAAEERAARRVIECQRRKGVQYPMGACVPAVAGFNPDDGHDDLRIDTVGLFGLREYRRVLVPECDPPLDPALGQEDFPVFIPRQPLLGRLAHQCQDVVAALRLTEDFLQFLLAETVTGDHFVDEHLHLRIGGIAAGFRHARRCRAGGKRTE